MKFKNSLVLGTIISAAILLLTAYIKGEIELINDSDDLLAFAVISLIGGLILGTCIYFTAKSNGVFLVVPIVGAFIIYSISQNDPQDASFTKNQEQEHLEEQFSQDANDYSNYKEPYRPCFNEAKKSFEFWVEKAESLYGKDDYVYVGLRAQYHEHLLSHIPCNVCPNECNANEFAYYAEKAHIYERNLAYDSNLLKNYQQIIDMNSKTSREINEQLSRIGQ